MGYVALVMSQTYEAGIRRRDRDGRETGLVGSYHRGEEISSQYFDFRLPSYLLDFLEITKERDTDIGKGVMEESDILRVLVCEEGTTCRTRPSTKDKQHTQLERKEGL